MSAAASAADASRPAPSIGMPSRWRGHSGRVYAVRMVALADLIPADEIGPSVLIGVARDKRGIAQAVHFALVGGGGSAEWVDLAVASGATEFHLHFDASGEAARRAVLADLAPQPRARGRRLR